MRNFKEELARQRLWQLWEEAQTDPAYARMFDEMAALEPRFEAVVEKLPDADQDTIRDYVSLCEAMSHRMLEYACEKLLLAEGDRAETKKHSAGY